MISPKAILAFLAAVLLSGPARGRLAITVISLPPMGLAATETAQVNLTNIGVFFRTGATASYAVPYGRIWSVT
jgi:hypothetical protein